MAEAKIRVGVIGANARYGWGMRALLRSQPSSHKAGQLAQSGHGGNGLNGLVARHYSRMVCRQTGAVDFSGKIGDGAS